MTGHSSWSQNCSATSINWVHPVCHVSFWLILTIPLWDEYHYSKSKDKRTQILSNLTVVAQLSSFRDHFESVLWSFKSHPGDFPGGAMVKNPPANAGDGVRALVREHPTCCRETKPVCHNYGACALEPMSHNYWAREPQLLKPVRLEPVLRNRRSHRNEKPAMKSSPRSPQLEKAHVQQQRPNAAKNK